MKTFCRFVVTIWCIGSSLGATAQLWSDVGVPGFTTNAISNTSPEYAPDFAIYANTKYAIYIDNNQLPVVMVNTTGTWTAMPSVNAGAIVASYPSIEVDAAGTPYISYVNFTAINIVVKKFDGTNWVLVGPANFGLSNAFGIQLAFNRLTNKPYICYYRFNVANKVNVMQFDGTNWVAVGAADFSPITTNVRMAISSSGVPYVAYVDILNSRKLSVQKFNGTSWVFEGTQAFTSTTNISQLDIAINSSNTPYVVYYSTNAPNNLNTVKFDGTNWVAVGAADFAPGTTFQPKIKISSTDVPYVAFRDNSVAGRCSVMKFNGTSWVNAGDAGFSGGAAQHPAIDFDASGNPNVLFMDGSLSNKSTAMKLCTASSSTVSSTTPGSVCGSGAVTLGATSATGTLRWYDATTNGNYIATGTSYTTPSLTSTSTYAVAAYDPNGCSSARTAVVATVKTIPTTTGTPGSNCGTGTVVLSATVSSGSINWFTSATGGSAIASGTTYTTPSISTTTTYYVEGLDAGCTSSARRAVIATINPIPSAPNATGGSRCDSGSVTLNASAPSGTINWYSVSSGGASLGTGTSYSTNNLSNTTAFYAGVTSSDGCSSSRTAAIATVNPLPLVNSATNGARCGAGTVVLNATPSAGTIHWYTQSTGGSSLGTGNSFTTPSLSVTTNFYAEAINNGCASITRDVVLATIKPFPTITANDVARCDAGTITFTGSSDGDISWFADEVGGVALGTGTSFTTPSLNFTTPYYVQATLDNCTSAPRIQVFATVNPTPPQPTITSNNINIEAPVLTSSSTTGNQWFKNGVSIPGATNNTYTIADAGSYKVQVTTLGCVSLFSAEIPYIITAIESSEGMVVYPNPASDEITISLSPFDKQRDVHIVIIDLMGREQFNGIKQGEAEARISLRGWKQGQYVALMSQGNIRVARTFIKSN